MDQGRAPQRRHLVGGQSQPRRPAARGVGEAPRACPSMYGDFRSTKSADRHERRVELLRVERDAK